MRSLLALALSGAVATSCLLAGRALLTRLGFRLASQSEGAALSAGTGFGLLIYVMAILGALRLYRPSIAWGLLVILAVLGSRGWREGGWLRWSKIVKQIRQASWPLQLLLVVLLIYGAAYAFVALAPTLEGDSIAGYLLTAREYARRGGIVSVDYAYTNSYPANGQMLGTLGFLLGGQIAAQLLQVWVMGLLALTVVYAFGRAWFSRQAALVAMTIWYGTYSVGYLAASGKIDLAWAAFDLLALLAFSRWYFAPAGQRQWRWLALAGFFLSVAGGTKHASAFTALLLVAGVTVRLWQDRERNLRAWAGTHLALVVPAAATVVWVARTYLMTGALGETGAAFRGDSGVAGFFRVLWQMSMLGNAISVEGPVGKSIGPAILATVPLLALFRGVERRVWHILAFSGLMLVLWYNGVQRARHLLPTLGLLALLAGYVITSLLALRPRLGQLIVMLMVVSLGLNLGMWGYTNFVSLQRLSYVFGRQGLDGYLAVNLPKAHWYPNYPVTAYARDRLPPDARIAALATGNAYYLERPVYPNWTQTPAQIPQPDEFVSRLKAARITHVFVNDFVVGMRGLEDAWFAQSEFQARYLTRLICAEGQCLYALR